MMAVVVGGGGGGDGGGREQLSYMGLPRAHVWLEKLKKQNHLILRFLKLFI